MIGCERVLELEKIEGVGPKTTSLLNKLNINSQEDLLHYYPFRYEVLKRSNLNEINDGDRIVIDGKLEGQPTIIYLGKNLKKMIFRISNKNTILNISLYNRPYLFNELKCGREITIIGKYNKIKNTIVASEVRFELLPQTPKIEPVYHTTAGLTSKQLTKFISSIIYGDFDATSYLPKYINDKYNFIKKREALLQIHVPSDIITLKKARQVLKYEELFVYLLKMAYLKEKIKQDKYAIKRDINIDKVNKFIKKLPFELTFDQDAAVKDIINDLTSDKRMNRLIQGDVGSGKTIVAFIASYANYLAKYQTALMVPTEILAKQHYEEAINLFAKEKMNVALLTSSTKAKEKKEIYESLKNGKIDLIIGTQSLIQEKIEFLNLGLVITDEQHRFGVNQRNNFKNKGISPDILSMSATPIPRTYALTIYGDLDISSIKTKPVGRKDVITYFKKEKDITEVLELMEQELKLKHQIYVVAPMIEDDENDDVENVKSLEEKMTKAFGKVYKIASVHGKMDSKDKTKVMKDFESGKVDILISTTVIEVGVNVKNASMIVIFNANLFGLSTLHQLRGRVGRSDIQSYCLLVAKQTQERLKFLEKTNDGFEISEYDFENRGEGDLFGVRQSGEAGLILSNIRKDYKMMVKAKEDALEFLDILLKEDNPEYSHILSMLEDIDNLD